MDYAEILKSWAAEGFRWVRWDGETIVPIAEPGVGEGVEFFHIIRDLKKILMKMEESFEHGWVY